jgi:hypothetical protein
LYPDIGPQITISRPWYDENTGVVIVSIDTSYIGSIFLFKYENNSFKELGEYITKRVFD